MANPEHIEILKKGWRAVNDYLHSGGWLDLTGINLSDGELLGRFQGGTDFCWVDFTGADLRNACLTKGNLWENKFISANLAGADFTQSELCYSEFDNTNCTGANFSESDLGGASFRNANLTQTDFGSACCEETSFVGATFDSSKVEAARFSGAGFGYTRFISANLSHALGLDEAEHYAPSLLDEETLAYSQKNIPDSFLIGCGFSSFKGCFMLSSYGDEEFDITLRTALRNRRVPCWLMREFPGYYPIESRDERVDVTKNQATEFVLIVCSEHSLTETHILLDIEHILDTESDMRSITILPVVVDDYFSAEWQNPLKQRLLDRQTIDFKNWRNSLSFEDGLNQLVTLLQTSAN